MWLALFAGVNVATVIGFVTLYNVLMGQVRPHQPASDYAPLQSTDAAVVMLASLLAMQVAHYVGYPLLLLGLALIASACLWPARRLCLKLKQRHRSLHESDGIALSFYDSVNDRRR